MTDKQFNKQYHKLACKRNKIFKLIKKLKDKDDKLFRKYRHYQSQINDLIAEAFEEPNK